MDKTVVRFREILVQQTGIENISPETKLEELSMDSLDFIEVVMEIEKEFDIDFPDVEHEKSMELTVQNLADWIDDILKNS